VEILPPRPFRPLAHLAEQALDKGQVRGAEPRRTTIILLQAGAEAARRAHNAKVTSSSLVPAPNLYVADVLVDGLVSKT
jgi:hypothetical protein